MNSKRIACVCLVVCWSMFAGAQEDTKEESFSHWDDIVSDLRSSVNTTLPNAPTETDPWNDVEISGGLGLAFTYMGSIGNENMQASGLLKGVSAHFGITLFHPQFLAEGAFRSYASEALSDMVKAQLREFELRLVHANEFRKHTLFRIGAGLSARYLEVTVKYPKDVGDMAYSQTTPSAVFMMGVARNFGRNVQVGPDVSYRSSLIGSTDDQSSVDLNLKFSARF